MEVLFLKILWLADYCYVYRLEIVCESFCCEGGCGILCCVFRDDAGEVYVYGFVGLVHLCVEIGSVIGIGLVDEMLPLCHG